MAQTIELLTSQKESLVQQERYSRFLKVGSLVFLVVYCLALLSLSSFWLYLQKQHQTASGKIILKEQQLEELRETESLLFLVKQRLGTIEKILAEKQIAYSQWLSHPESFLPLGVVVEEWQFRDQKTLTLQGTAENALVLADFLEGFVQTETPTPFSAILLNSAKREAEGDYNFSLEINVAN